MSTERAIREAGRVWKSTVAEIPALKKRIRAAAEEEIAREIAERQLLAARAIRKALDHGATKTALRDVTTKDFRDFQAYVALGAEGEDEN